MSRGSASAAGHKRLGRKLQGAGYPCGEETRSRVIEAAIALFGLRGLDGTATRAIAERAGVALPALQYYFTSKDGLYLACAEHIATRMGERMSPLASRIEGRLDAGNVGRKELTALVHLLLDGFCDLILGPDVPEGWIPFILREQASPAGPVFEVIRKQVMGRVMNLFTALMIEASPAAPDQTRARMAVLALVGHVLVFRTSRSVALHVLECSGIDAECLSAIKADVRAHADQVLFSIAEGQGNE